MIGIAVTSKDPTRFALANVVFSYEPYGLMVRRNDAAFRLAVNRALAGLYRSGGFVPIYERWFVKALPFPRELPADVRGKVYP